MRTGCLMLLWCGSLCAQSPRIASAAIVGAGYSAPQNFTAAAPGQVISLMVYGLDLRLTQPVIAPGTPLPAVLAGFSVSFQQGQTSLAVPLLGISQRQCTFPNATADLCESLTVISIQVPFEIMPDCRLCGRPTIPAFFVVSDGRVSKALIETALPPDNIHITDACDTTAQLPPPDGPYMCGKIVTHADGTRPDIVHPAKIGEELVMYAFGLGRTDPLVKSGTASPNPPVQLPASGFGLYFNYTANAAPSLPPTSPGFELKPPAPAFVGLVPGFVGLYQVNFVVPPAPAASYVPCSGSANSNLTVTLFTDNSYDGAGLCVQPQ